MLTCKTYVTDKVGRARGWIYDTSIGPPLPLVLVIQKPLNRK